MSELEHLIHIGYDVDAVDEHRRTALMVAAGAGETEVVEWCLEHGADPLKCDEDGRTALHSAAASGHASICELIIDRAGPRAMQIMQTEDAVDVTAAHLAHVGMHFDVIRIFLVAHSRAMQAREVDRATRMNQQTSMSTDGHGVYHLSSRALAAERRGYPPTLLHSPARSTEHGSVFNRVKTP